MLPARIIFLCFALLTMSSAQAIEKDTTKVKHEHVVRKWKFLFGFDGRKSIILNHDVKFSGMKIGVEYKEKHKFGIGIYDMRQAVFVPDFKPALERPGGTDTASFKLSYTSLFWEKIWFENDRWELSTPIHLGTGTLDIRYRDVEGNMQFFGNPTSGLLEMSFVAEYRVFRWFAIGAGVGRRWINYGEDSAKQTFGGPVSILQFKVLAGQLYKMAFKKDELEPWK